MSRQRVERMELYQKLLREGITDPVVLAHRLRVHERTIYRYGNRLAGGKDRRVVRYHECKPKVLAHLQAWPNSRFSAWDLARFLGLRGDGLVKRALQDLHQEGLVQAVVEPRDPSTLRQLVTRWQVTQGQVKAG
ncbi:hypothetical protein ACQPYK_25105 [Streptosporangium sp. CA-135522]|uniref:hypothetical protein n=1 Tax=Streptosporangium sp. CA-135522 TaxID=3240072 RepID=UPI003D9484B3